MVAYPLLVVEKDIPTQKDKVNSEVENWKGFDWRGDEFSL